MSKMGYNERASVPVSVDRLRMSRECVFYFTFLIDKLPVTSPSVDPDPSMCPCEHFIPLGIIDDVPCCCCFSVFGSCAGGFPQWVSSSSSSSSLCCCCPFAVPFRPRP